MFPSYHVTTAGGLAFAAIGAIGVIDGQQQWAVWYMLRLLTAYACVCSRTGACLRSDAVSDGWMTDVVLCLISQSESYSPAQYHVL